MTQTPSPHPLQALAEKARAATAGPWTGDRHDGTVKYDLVGAGGKIVIHGNDGDGNDPYGILSEEDERYLIAANPSVILALVERLERLERAEKALSEIGRRAMNQEGDRTFDDCIRDLGWIDDECRRLTGAHRTVLLADQDYPS